MKELNWVVLGCGVIANELATAMKNNGRCLYGVANRTYAKAVAFADKYGISKVYKNYDEVFDDNNVDIVYITTPHNTHIEYINKGLMSNKNVLSEKSITLNSAELESAVSFANKNNLVLAEAMTLYHMPIINQVYDRINKGELGKVNIITLNFGSYKDYNMNNRFFNKNLAGGAMLDIGVYALSFARLFMLSNPKEVLSQMVMAPTGVDENATLILKNEDNQMATVALSLHSKQPKRAMLSCDKAYVEIMEYPRAMSATITYTDTGDSETITDGDTTNALWYEVLDMEAAVLGKENKMHLDLSQDVMKIMTEFRNRHSIVYPEEEA